MDFEDLYRATYPRVLAYSRSMAAREDADDVVAEAYAIAWRRQRDIPRDAELGWLIGVTRRVLATPAAATAGPARCMRSSTSNPGSPDRTRPTGSKTPTCAPR